MKVFLLLLNVLTLLAGCQGGARDAGTYSFRNLEIKYPSGSMEVSNIQEVPDKGLVSLLIQEKKNKLSRIEIGISEFSEDFLDTVPQEELLGELAAEVDEMERNVSSIPGVSVLEKSEIQWSSPPSRPEAFSFSKIQEDDKIIYLVFSAKIVGNYCVYSVSRSSNPSTMEVFNDILDTITTKSTNP